MGFDLRAVVIAPDGTAQVTEVDASLAGLQSLVGGYIEAVGLLRGER